MLRNNGSGHSAVVDPVSLGIQHRASDGITTADGDNDGDLDLLQAGSGQDAHLYLNDGQGNFTYHQSFADTPGYIGGFADLDNDGDLDLYFAGDTKICFNDGTGTFTVGSPVPITAARDPRAVAFADIDGDSDLDFAIGDKRAGRNFLFRNDLPELPG
ncbi:MAG: VCBS repeat-containing protein [Planctomycetaceae bacterium]|nr:VCBS repeat-containing protein [Planctomycetaceae bacterium]